MSTPSPPCRPRHTVDSLHPPRGAVDEEDNMSEDNERSENENDNEEQSGQSGRGGSENSSDNDSKRSGQFGTPEGADPVEAGRKGGQS